MIGNYKKNVSKKSNPNADKEQILYTESIIKELLSTELVSDYGFITNLNFNYLTNINLNINSLLYYNLIRDVKKFEKFKNLN